MSRSPPNRLLWQCRRGMLELDALLLAFIRDAYADLDEPGRRAFAWLLQQSDVDLYAWLARGEAPPARLRAVVDRLRACRVGSLNAAPAAEAIPAEAPRKASGAHAA